MTTHASPQPAATLRRSGKEMLLRVDGRMARLREKEEQQSPVGVSATPGPFGPLPLVS